MKLLLNLKQEKEYILVLKHQYAMSIFHFFLKKQPPQECVSTVHDILGSILCNEERKEI